MEQQEPSKLSRSSRNSGGDNFNFPPKGVDSIDDKLRLVDVAGKDVDSCHKPVGLNGYLCLALLQCSLAGSVLAEGLQLLPDRHQLGAESVQLLGVLLALPVHAHDPYIH